LAADHTLCACSAAAAVLALPAAVRLPLRSTGWRHGGTATLLLQRLTAALQQEQQQPILQQQCLLAARSWLPPDMWPLLSSVL